MALEKIGLSAVLDDANFQSGLKRYTSGLGQMESATKATANVLSSIGAVAAGALTIGIGAATAAFGALVSVVVICIPSVTNATANIDLTSDFALPTQTFNTNSQADATSTYALTANLITELNIGSVFSGLAANQQCGIALKNNTIGGANLILGVHLKYTTA